MKKLFLFSLSAVVALGLAACGGSTEAADPNILVNSDFDTLLGWIPEQQSASLSTEKAHSGRYSIKVDANTEYSLGFHTPLSRLRDTHVKKLKVSAWAFVPTADAHASLVTTLSNPTAPDEKPLLWEAQELGKDKAYGKWVEINKVIALPDNAVPTTVLGLYLWRTSGTQPVYLDDLRVSIEP